MVGPKLRSQNWFHDRDDAALTANYIEKFLANGFTRIELQSGRPIIGIAQTGSDLSPYNRHHIALAERVREGISSSPDFPTRRG